MGGAEGAAPCSFAAAGSSAVSARSSATAAFVDLCRTPRREETRRRQEWLVVGMKRGEKFPGIGERKLESSFCR
jgi:hypothetical protein